MAINMCGQNCDCDKPIDERFKKEPLEYKVYYHTLLPTERGLRCLGSNEPNHPEGSCLNPKHPLVYPNMKTLSERMAIKIVGDYFT